MATWKDRVNEIDFTIIMGDKTRFTPQYLTQTISKKVDYNIAEFVFKEVDGSLVKRGGPRGTQYDIEIIFTGPDNLDVAKKFQKSAEDSGAWSILHPFYDGLLVQPVSLTFDNSQLNVTKIRGTVIETFGHGLLNAPPDPAAKVASSVILHNRKSAYLFYTALGPVPEVSDLQILQNHIKAIYGALKAKLATYQAFADNYFAAYNAANAVLNTAIYDSQQIAATVARLIQYPAYAIDTVVNRLNMFNAQLAIFQMDIDNIANTYNRSTSHAKKIYENNGMAAITGMCVAVFTNITNDYLFRPDILRVVQTVLDAYNGYIANLMRLQSANGGEVDSYIPDAELLSGLAQIVRTATAALFNLTLTAKQQRIFYVQTDTNIILLAWQLYGLQPDCSTIKTLCDNNNIGLNERLVVKKGRQIIYYV